MATTANGLPYPTGTDYLVNGDDSVKALADALESRGHGLRLLARRLVCDASSGGYTWWRFPAGDKVGALVAVSVTCELAGATTGVWFSPDRLDILNPVTIGGKLYQPGGALVGNGTVTWGSVIVIGTYAA